MKNKNIFGLLLIIIFFFSGTVQAQMERKRVQTDEAVQTFSTPSLMAQSNTQQLAPGNLNVTIMHSFGIATRNTVRNFFGLDNVQNVRLGLDFGLTERWSAGIGRSSFFNIVDLRTKYAIMQQNTSGSNPISISLKGDIGVVTQENNRPFEDDLSTLASVTISRKVNDYISLQLAPMYGYFSTVRQGDDNNLFSVGLGTEIRLSNRYSLITEYFPVLGNRHSGTKNAFTLGVNIETGGHVFQLFLTSTRWHLEQYVLSNNSNQFWEGDFRFGFNVNRIFGL